MAGRPSCFTDCRGLPCSAFFASSPQGQLLMLVMQYCDAGSLFGALQAPTWRPQLRWAARCAGWGQGRAQLRACLPDAGAACCSSLAAPTAVASCGCPLAHPDTCRGALIALDLAEVLTFLHAQGVLHGDVKPRCRSWLGCPAWAGCVG